MPKFKFTGPNMDPSPAASVGVFNLTAEGSLHCFRHGEELTAEQHEALSAEGKAKVAKLVEDGFAVEEE